MFDLELCCELTIIVHKKKITKFESRTGNWWK